MELLVAVRQPEGKDGPLDITLTTDMPGEVFLHWGVKKGGKEDWYLPPADLRPANSLAPPQDSIALDTPFQISKDAECQVMPTDQ
jgi:hypothetical protein